MIRTISLRGHELALLLLSIIALCATSANAYTISLTGGMSGGNPSGQPLYEVSGLVQGDAFNVAWGGVSGLNVTGMVTVSALSGSAATLQVMLDNLSTPISGSDPRVTSFGLDVDGFTSLASAVAGGTFLTTADTTPPAFPGFNSLVDACATSGNNCAGGGSGGIPAGGSDTFQLAVNGSFAGTLKLANFALKVQGGPSGNSFELAGVPTPKVPEPATMTLVAFGAAMISMPWRKR